MPTFPQNTGWIEVVTGAMFSGKTEELIRRLRLAKIARQHVLVFKPAIDNRFATQEIVSRADVRLECHPVQDPWTIWERAREAQTVGIDEAQFFPRELVKVCEALANAGKRVIVAGLDQDFRGEPFETIASLLCVAEYIDKVHAICVRCGNPADRSQRIVASTSRIVVGDTDVYEARCRRCWVPDAPGPHQSDLQLARPNGRVTRDPGRRFTLTPRGPVR